MRSKDRGGMLALQPLFTEAKSKADLVLDRGIQVFSKDDRYLVSIRPTELDGQKQHNIDVCFAMLRNASQCFAMLRNASQEEGIRNIS